MTTRTSLGYERTIVLALTALLTIVPAVPRAAAAVAGLAILALTAIAWRRRETAAASLGLVSTSCVVLGLAGLGPQQVVFPFAFAIYAVVVRRVRWLRGAAAWFRPGALGRGILAIVAGIAAVSAAALLAWYAITRPDLADVVRTFVPEQPLWLLVIGALVFALVNAAIEEAAYRGVLLSALEAVLGRGAAPIVLQAVAFAALHVHGLPRGSAGVGLALVYGVALGALCRKAGGLLAPWLAHALTDVVIAGIVLALARR